MPRLFTALEIPSEIGLLLSGLRGGLRGARWIVPENYHVTLRFVGDVDDRTADEIVDRLSRIGRPPVPVTFDRVGSFGSKKPHSINVRVVADPNLIELQAENERIIQRIGLPPERRKFTPHVTIARCKKSTAADVAHWLACHGDFRAVSFTATHFVLFSSKASTGGGPYVVEDAFELGLRS